ncbi:hypothetical protein AHAS_Ahas13G0236200 [Arachis hypogaea]
MFMGWMKANKEFEVACNLTFAELPSYFVWDKQGHLWRPWKQGHTFANILSVDGVAFYTYKEACYALGLLQDDKEFIDAINEASSWVSPFYIRRLFAMLLMSNNIVCPDVVWQQCWKHCADDVLYDKR